MLTLLLSVFYMPVMAADEIVTSNANGYNDVPFSNGYNGFCLDKWLDIAYEDDAFVVKDTSAAINNVTGKPISQYLKILFVDFFEDNFEKDSNGEYKIKNAINTQATIYGFVDNDSKDWNYKPLTDIVEKYNDGRRIDDHGEMIVVGDDKIIFDFIVMTSQIDGQQDFFGYKLTVETNVHEHQFSEDWKNDEENHWHECECEEKADEETHEGNKADCVTSSTCIDCGKELSGVDSETHTGNTVVKNKVEPEEFKPGYTGDIHCKDCDSLLEKGKEIPAIQKDINENIQEDVEEDINEDISVDNKKDAQEDIEENTSVTDKNKAPKTDDNPYIIWLVFMLISVAYMVVVIRKNNMRS